MGNFQGRKLLRFCGYSQNLGAWHLLVAPASNSWKFSPRKSFSTNSQKFSPTKVSLYTVCNGKDIRVSFCKTNSAGKYHKMINLLRSACKKSSKCNEIKNLCRVYLVKTQAGLFSTLIFQSFSNVYKPHPKMEGLTNFNAGGQSLHKIYSNVQAFVTVWSRKRQHGLSVHTG